jgi:hypothetical protein
MGEEVSLHVLTTSTKMTQCLWHADHRGERSDQFKDGNGYDRERFLLTGVSGQRRLKSQPTSARTKGHMDCGCPIQESLFYFFMWKTWKLRGYQNRPDGGIMEGMSRVHLKPRVRNIVAHSVAELTGLQTTHFYVDTGRPFRETFEDKKAFALQLASLQLQRTALYNVRLGLPPITVDDMSVIGPVITSSFNAYLSLRAAGLVDASTQTDSEID